MEDVQVLSWQVTPESKLSTQDWHKIPLNNINLLRKDPAVNCACLSLSISLINDVNQVTWVSWSITCKPIGELQLSNMTNLEECGESMEGEGGGGCSPHWKRGAVCTCMCARGPAAWSVITRWLYNVTQSAYQHFRCQLPRAVPLALHPHLPHVRPLKDRRDPNPYTNQPTLCVPPIGQASRPKGKEQLWAQPIAAPYTLQHV